MSRQYFENDAIKKTSTVRFSLASNSIEVAVKLHFLPSVK